MANIQTAWLVAMSVVVAVPSAAASLAKTDPETFVMLDPVSVPIIDGGRLEGRLDFTVVIAARDSASAEDLDGNVAKLRDTLIDAALDFSSLYASSKTPVDARLLVAKLQAAMLAKDPRVAAIYLVDVSARPA
ncbi:hypothetical protein [Sphingorhabdus sp. M41]|uniref:hypothetical protein n=1 Tax=Sphingorhabdus sp. M41 TaxID=1806885 RepID=UPI00078B8795|nr:hypothetical protein [Sphingorhabdus sp. M41]AMO72594.1 hypothetical protein AZE99_12700 [Sphingorhabdus sp. M41]